LWENISKLPCGICTLVTDYVIERIYKDVMNNQIFGCTLFVLISFLQMSSVT